MTVKYLTGYGGNKIERVEIVRETAASVYLPARKAPGAKERREAKRSEYSQYHDSWDEARAYLLDQAQEEVKAARIVLERANGKLGNIKGMRSPEVKP